MAKIENGILTPDEYFKIANHGEYKEFGEIVNGYQGYELNGAIVFKRTPDLTGFTKEEIDLLTAHPDAHVLERHGPDVTDNALKKRAETPSIAPDGHYQNNAPPHSSKFESAEKLKEALNNTKPGTANFNPPESGDIYVFEYPLTGQATTPFGYGIPSGGKNPIQMYKVQVVYKKLDGVWKLLTMYPKL